MKDHILTDNERRKLNKWIQTGQEGQTTRNLFTGLRTSLPRLRDDKVLILKIRAQLRQKRRWNKRPRHSQKSS